MAAAYAALVSLMHLIEHTRLHQGSGIFFEEEQLALIESLHESVIFLKTFLESYNYGCGDKFISPLENEIMSAACVAQDIIDSYAVDKILAQSSEEQRSYNLMEQAGACLMIFCENPLQMLWEPIEIIMRKNITLQEVKEKMDFIKKEAQLVMKSNIQHMTDVNLISSSVSSHVGKSEMIRNDYMVDIDDNELLQLMEKLTRDPAPFKIIPITGMGGIGKTTFAKIIYANTHIVEHFIFRAYFTISQEYDEREMLLSLLRDTGVSLSGPDEKDIPMHELGQRLYQHLTGWSYFIVLDDMWSTNAWQMLKEFLPQKSGSRILVTTRLLDIANQLGSPHVMNFLDEVRSWRLLRKKVFGEKDCHHPELEDIGKNIARNCKGLPLSIAVIGSLLAKSRMTSNEWQYFADNINKTLTLADDERCLRILSLSYNHLPIHLKPCFLYMGAYPEDNSIRVSELIKLWVCEGFLKPIETKRLEETAEEYLKDLVERHLIFVDWSSTGKMRTCSIHDLLRELCLREAHKEKFIYVAKESSPALDINRELRVVLDESWPRQKHYTPFQATRRSLIRSLRCDSEEVSLQPFNLKLMRVLNWTTVDVNQESIILKLVNSRYLKFSLLSSDDAIFVSLTSRLWNLQTLIVLRRVPINVTPLEIWRMPQLMHIVIDGICLTDPQTCTVSGQDGFVLTKLQTLSCIESFKCVESVIKRIPNIIKLNIVYGTRQSGTEQELTQYHLQNIRFLEKLQSLYCSVPNNQNLLDCVLLPESLKKLSLLCASISWEDVETKIGPLPNLEKLKLQTSRAGERWIRITNQFRRLKVLEIKCDRGLVYWEEEEEEDVHFPVLERLVLYYMGNLKEIPSSIGKIETLQSIELVHCSKFVVASAREILEKQQQEFENHGLRLIVRKLIQVVDRRSDGTIIFKVQIFDKRGYMRNVYFSFDIENDTPMSVANEMVRELDINSKVEEIENMIGGEISGLLPNWKIDHVKNYQKDDYGHASLSSIMSHSMDDRSQNSDE